jgi:hypothetical protein
MNQKAKTTEDQLQNLLRWLDQDQARAGEKYEQIRRRLIFIFRCRGCASPEDIADQCIDRVAKIITKQDFSYEGDPSLFFYGVAKLVAKEQLRLPRVPEQVPEPFISETKELQQQCLDRCLEALSPRSRRLILDYYDQAGRTNMAHRREMSERLGLSLNVLRIQTCRIRTVLKQCVVSCTAQEKR